MFLFLANHHSLCFCLLVFVLIIFRMVIPLCCKSVCFSFRVTLRFRPFRRPLTSPLNSKSPSLLKCDSFPSTLLFQPMCIVLFLNYVMLIRDVLWYCFPFRFFFLFSYLITWGNTCCTADTQSGWGVGDTLSFSCWPGDPPKLPGHQSYESVNFPSFPSHFMSDCFMKFSQFCQFNYTNIYSCWFNTY